MLLALPVKDSTLPLLLPPLPFLLLLLLTVCVAVLPLLSLPPLQLLRLLLAALPGARRGRWAELRGGCDELGRGRLAPGVSTAGGVTYGGGGGRRQGSPVSLSKLGKTRHLLQPKRVAAALHDASYSCWLCVSQGSK